MREHSKSQSFENPVKSQGHELDRETAKQAVEKAMCILGGVADEATGNRAQPEGGFTSHINSCRGAPLGLWVGGRIIP